MTRVNQWYPVLVCWYLVLVYLVMVSRRVSVSVFVSVVRVKGAIRVVVGSVTKMSVILN